MVWLVVNYWAAKAKHACTIADVGESLWFTDKCVCTLCVGDVNVILVSLLGTCVGVPGACNGPV